MKGLLRRLVCSVFSIFIITGQAADGPFALNFDGVDDYVSVPHSTLFNGYQLTVTAWIKTTQASGEQGLVNKYVANSLNGWNVFLFNGSVRAWYFRNSANYIWDGGRGLLGPFVADGQWHHIAFVVNSTEGRLYVDGLPWDARFWDGAFGATTTTQELRLGSYPGSGFYNGLMDEVTVWSRALTGAEIVAIRSNSLVGVESELRGYWRLNEGVGNTAENSGFSAQFNGTLVNGPTWAPGVLLKPGVMTAPAIAVTSRSGRLQGVANPGGTNATGWFEWGTTTSYGNVTPPQPLGSGGNTNFIQSITGLSADVTIHFRAVASNALGVAFGANSSFTPPRMSMTQERNDHTATLLPNGKVLVTGGFGASINFLGFATNSAELFDPAVGTWSPANPMAVRRAAHTATLLQNGKVLVVDFQGAELYDPVNGAWTPTGSPVASHNLHTATLLQNGKVLVAGGISSQCEIYDPASGTWTFTGALTTGRYNHTATLLQNGKVLVAGGEDTINHTALVSAELYDPASGIWSPTGPMHDARIVHTATMQMSGHVLVVGGSTTTNYLATAERYDPGSGTWSRLTTQLSTARGYHTATLLPRGTVLVFGGYPDDEPSAEVLVPTFDGEFWFPVADPILARWHHTATLMADGRILVVGGNNVVGGPIADVELYDPHNGSFAPTDFLGEARYAHTTTLLPDGRVLAAGHGITEIFDPSVEIWLGAQGLNVPRNSHSATLLTDGTLLVAGGSDGGFNVTTSAELFQPSNNTWTITGPLTTNRSAHTATLLPTGKVLVAGGIPGNFSQPISSAELYDPIAKVWTITGPMTSRRVGHTATLLPNGKVLVAGGSADNFGGLFSAEFYDLATEQWTAINPMTAPRSGHKATLLPNGMVLVAGGIPGSFSLAHFSAEIFDPATGNWTAVNPMNVRRQNATSTLLLDGRVLMTGGYGEGYVASAEIYDPATGTWKLAGSKSVGTASHTATLLPNGKVLVSGGWTGNGGAANAELYDLGLGFTALSQPSITTRNSPLVPGSSLVLTGNQFRGVSSASYGTDKDSPSDHPIVKLRNLESERTISLNSTNWTTNVFRSLPVSGMPRGWAMATVFVNGIPGKAALLEISRAIPVRPRLIDSQTLVSGAFQFRFTNSVGALFGALSTTNMALPLGNWAPLGLVSEISPGQFQFQDAQGTDQQRFYGVRSY